MQKWYTKVQAKQAWKYILGSILLLAVCLVLTSKTSPTIQLTLDNRLTAQVETPRLILRSVTEHDRPDLDQLFTDPRVMDTLSDVTAFSKQMIDHIFYERWLKQWGAFIPYSGFVVIEKDHNKFVGFIRVEGTKTPGQLEISYALHKDVWGKRYGSEMVHAIVQVYVPYLKEKGYLSKGRPVYEIIATVREDNPASRRVLEKNGFVFTHQVLNKQYLRCPIN